MMFSSALRGAAGALGDLTGTLRVGTDDVARLAAAGAPTILADFAEAARGAELARAVRQVDGDLLRTFLGRHDDLLQTARTAAEDLVRTYQTVPPDLLRAARRQESTKDRTGAERYRRSAREVAMGHPSPQPVFEHAQKPGTRTAEPGAQGARRPELRRLGYDAGKAALKPEPHVAVGRSSQYRPVVDVSDAAPMLELAAAPEPTETVGDQEDLPPEPTAPSRATPVTRPKDASTSRTPEAPGLGRDSSNATRHSPSERAGR